MSVSTIEGGDLTLRDLVVTSTLTIGGSESINGNLTLGGTLTTGGNANIGQALNVGTNANVVGLLTCGQFDISGTLNANVIDATTVNVSQTLTANAITGAWATPNYVRLGPVVIQWGSAPAASHVTFPIPYSTNPTVTVSSTGSNPNQFCGSVVNIIPQGFDLTVYTIANQEYKWPDGIPYFGEILPFYPAPFGPAYLRTWGSADVLVDFPFITDTIPPAPLTPGGVYYPPVLSAGDGAFHWIAIGTSTAVSPPSAPLAAPAPSSTGRNNGWSPAIP